TAASGVTAHNDGFNERILNCLETRDANSDQCFAALEVSPVDSNFFRVLADNLDNMPAKEEPQPEVDVYSLVKECAATQHLDTDGSVGHPAGTERRGVLYDLWMRRAHAYGTRLRSVLAPVFLDALLPLGVAFAVVSFLADPAHIETGELRANSLLMNTSQLFR